MKQFQFQYRQEDEFAQQLKTLQEQGRKEGWNPQSILFHVFSDTSVFARVEPVLHQIRKAFPKALYVGCTGNGNLLHGKLGGSQIGVTVDVLEEASSQMEILQLPLSYETQEESARIFLESVKARPWVKAVEMITTIGGLDMPVFCRKLSDLPDDICFFGGGALAADVYDGHSDGNFIISSGGELSTGAAAFILQGGPDFHACAIRIMGWRKLGLPFQMTSVHNNIVKTINHTTALDLYQQYLRIPKAENFLDIAVVFPFSFEEDGIPYLRVATAYGEDGSLVLGADVPEGTMGNIAFGDPSYIAETVDKKVQELSGFGPDIIRLFSCSSRRYYWGEEVDRETQPFESVAPTSGFYTSGEFHREGHNLVQHNVTIVAAALREGERKSAGGEPVLLQRENLSRQILINRCLTTFINKASAQLQEANHQLARLAITDGLTGLNNRVQIEKQIRQALGEYLKDPKSLQPPVVIMMDLDHFKNVNDAYGHQEGDAVLKYVSSLFLTVLEKKGLKASVGRWGGEEFMFLLQGPDLSEAAALADEIRKEFAAHAFSLSGTHTLSAGVAAATPDDTADTLTIRADKGLYLAKESGRNRSVVVSLS